MYRIRFKNVCEVRMGSPYNIAEPELVGQFVPDLSQFDFQDKSSISISGDRVAISQWAIEENDPGFIIWCISGKKRTVWKSPRFRGICEALSFVSEDLVEISIFNADQRTSDSKLIRVSFE